jgi:hypothetical protein
VAARSNGPSGLQACQEDALGCKPVWVCLVLSQLLTCLKPRWSSRREKTPALHRSTSKPCIFVSSACTAPVSAAKECIVNCIVLPQANLAAILLLNTQNVWPRHLEYIDVYIDVQKAKHPVRGRPVQIQEVHRSRSLNLSSPAADCACTPKMKSLYVYA